MRGTLRWLSPAEGGRSSAFAGDRYAAIGWVEPGSSDDAWSIVISGIAPGASECAVEAEWLVWPDVDFDVHPGDVIAIGDGPRLVAHVTIAEVAPG